MIQLYQFKPLWNVPNPSPFCIKLETYLRLAKLPYKTTYTYKLQKTPKGKLPYIKDEEIILGDSTFIIKYLKKKYGDTLDNALTKEQQALALSVQRMIEEHLYWAMFYSRWVDHEGWKSIKPVFFKGLPWFLNLFLPEMLRKKFIKVLHGHGLGRHTQEEIYQLGNDDIDAISTLLSDKTYFFGEQVTSIDATVWGFVTLILNTPVESPLKLHTKTCANLVAYDQRMRKLFDSLAQTS